jgi:hypothetical protein
MTSVQAHKMHNTIPIMTTMQPIQKLLVNTLPHKTNRGPTKTAMNENNNINSLLKIELFLIIRSIRYPSLQCEPSMISIYDDSSLIGAIL